MFEGKKNTDKWFPVVLTDDTDFKTEETGVAFGDVTVKFSAEGATSLSTYTVATAEWKETAEGKYWLLIGASEFTAEGKYEVSVKITAGGAITYNFTVEVRDKTLAELIDDIGTLLTRIPDTISLVNINGEVDSALDTPIPGSPTANSINERIKAMDDLTQASGGGDLAAIKAKTDLLAFTSGNIHAHTKAKDSTLALSTQEKADANAEVDIALNTAIPGGPTANSINERMVAIDNKLPTGNIADQTDITAIKAKTDLLAFTTGNIHSHIKVTDNIGLSALQKADVNTEVDNALNTAIPGSPTADSINQRIKAMDELTEATGGGDLAAIKAKTDLLAFTGGNVHSHTKVQDDLALTAQQKLDVNTEADTALSDINLDHLLKVAVTGADVIDNSVIAQMVSSAATADWDTFVNTTEALQALRDRGDAAWATGGGGTAPQLLQNTTIATLASQVEFTLTAGSPDNKAYEKALAVITDSATSTQKAQALVKSYLGSTKTITLAVDPGVFTMAAGDTIDIIAMPQQLPLELPATNGGLGTVDASNRIAGVAGTKNTLDDLNDVSIAQVNTEVDNALNTAIPGSPTADSINQRIKAMDELTEASGAGDLAAIKAKTDLLAFTAGNVHSHTKVQDDLALTAQQKLDVNTEVDNALNTVIPGSPTADSINQRIKAIDDLTQAAGAGDLAAIKSKTDSLAFTGGNIHSHTKAQDNLALTAQQKLDVNTEVDAALNTAIPGSPTANSINQRIKAIDELTEASGGGDLAAIKAKTDSLAFTSGNVHSHVKVKESTLALSAQEKLDVNAEADVALTDYDTGGGVGKESSVTSIQNNTRFVAGTPNIMLVPDSGDNVYKITADLYDTNGNMEDPDNNEIAVLVENSGGTDKNDFYDDNGKVTAATASTTFTGHVKMVKIETGVYETFLRIPAGEAIDDWAFQFSYEEASATLRRHKVSHVLEENPGSVTLANSAANKEVVARAIREFDSDTVIGASPSTGSIEKGIRDKTDLLTFTTGNLHTHTKAQDNLALTAQQKLDVNTEVDNALDTVIPGSPTADSINERLKAVDVLTEASGAGDLAAIKAKTDSLAFTGGNVHSHTKVQDDLALTAQQKLDVNTEADTALSDINLDHLLKVAVTGADVIDNSVIAQMVSKAATADWDTFVNTEDSLQAIRDRGDSAWTTGGGGGNPNLLQNTTIATLTTQISFTLSAGSSDDNAYNKGLAVITDSATSTQKAQALVKDYDGATKRITLAVNPGVFTMAVGDTIDILAAPQQLPLELPATNGGLPTANASNQVAGIAGTKNTLDDLNDVSTAQVNTEVDNALNTAIPGSPTADSINERVKAIDDKLPAGSIADQSDVTAIKAKTDLLAFTAGNVHSHTKVQDNLALTAQQKLDVNTEVDTALNTVIPGSPTADSINQRIKALDDLTQASGAGDLAAIKAKTDSLAFTSGNLHSHTKAQDNLGLTTQQKLDVNAEVDVALDTAIPGTPTTNSINERVKTIDDKLPTGDIADQTDITAIKAKTDLLAFTSGNVHAHTKAKDASLPLSTQEKADANAEVDTALNTAIPGSPVADSINERIKAIDDLVQAAGAGDLAAIKVKTDQLAFTSGNVDSHVKTKDAAAPLSAQEKLDVNTEVKDVIFTDTITELSGGQPAKNPTPAQAWMLSYMRLRNAHDQSGSLFQIKDDAGNVITKAPVTDVSGVTEKEQLVAP